MHSLDAPKGRILFFIGIPGLDFKYFFPIEMLQLDRISV